MDIEMPRLNGLEATKFIMKECPTPILILSNETLNESHGTGVLLKRYFGAFPSRHLFSLYMQKSGNEPWLKQSFRVTLLGSKGKQSIEEFLKQSNFVPDIIFSTAVWESDLELLNLTLKVVGPKVPVIQFFMDLMPFQEQSFFDQLRELSPSVHSIWALTQPMQRILSSELGRSVEHITGLHLKLPKDLLFRETRDNGEKFRTVMIGNFYNPDMVPFMREFWKQCRALLPGLGPIEWYVDASKAQGLFEEEVLDPGLEFIWRGFFAGALLRERLIGADLALLPFNCGERASSNYQRYSLPSRISEYASAGLPVFAFATKDTPLSKFVMETGCGKVTTGVSIEKSVEAFVEYVEDTKARENAGKRGLKLAFENFDLDRFRSWFHAFLIDTIRDSKTETTL